MGGKNTKKRTDREIDMDSQKCIGKSPESIYELEESQNNLERSIETKEPQEVDDIRKAIKEKDIEKIHQLVTPKGLVPADTSLNVLETSLEVSYYLKKGYGQHKNKCKLVGNKVEDFACRLLAYSQDVPEIVEKPNFIYCIEKLTHTAIEYKARKFLAAQQIQDFLKRIWVRRHYKESDTCFTWILGNTLTIFEVFLWPFVLFCLFVFRLIMKNDEKNSNRPDPYDLYMEHFETPYFIFLRDMISYITLLVLHYMVCVQTTGLQFSVLEWIIMVFFVGRVFLEVDQCINEGSLYIADFWNKVDVASIVVYIFTIICRGLVKQPKSDLLVMASCSYGINAMLLTLRVFGQFMELKESTGTKQIALLKIIKAVAVIFVQILSAMLGFSFILTKIHIAEVSHLAETNVTTNGVCKHSVGIVCWWHFFNFLAWSIVGSGDQKLLTLENGFFDYASKLLYLIFLIVTAVIIMNMLIALLSHTYQEVEDNALFEWAYRKAIIIKTYNNCHPVPVPLSIISIPLKLFYKCYQKHCQKKRAIETTDKDNQKLLTEFCKKIERKYFAEYGDFFPQDDLSKIDRQLSENKRLMGHIANEIFKESTTIHSISDIQEWDCIEGINAVGRQLFHVKCKDCRNQRKYRYCVHGARHKSSLSREWPGFEVLIQHNGKRRYLGIGVASSDYNLHDFPGRKPNSVGYHVDTGGIFDQDHQEFGRKDEDSMSFAGDLVGCMVLFDEEQEEKGEKYLPVQFTRNGRFLGKGNLKANFVGDIHPLISMAFSGIHVMFRKITNIQGAPLSSTEKIQDMERSIEQLQQNIKSLKESVYKDNQAYPSKQDQLVTNV